MQIPRRTIIAIGALAGSLLFSSTALAQSTALYPASDTVSMGSAPMTIGEATCTFHGGSVTLPAGGSSGAVTLTYKERPSFTECETIYSVETKGTWKISMEYGTASGRITIPAEGLIVRVPVLENEIVYFSTSAITLNVAWNNGFTSPVNVSSALDVWGSPEMWHQDGKYHPTNIGPSIVSLTDTTHPSSMPVLGP